jgi:hypothetical protein
MLNVLFTIDTEVYPLTKNWREEALASDIRRDIYGEVEGGAVGLDYQLETFSKHGLKACFMIESLFSAVPEVGNGPLKEVVRAVAAGGHDIQLHLHTEWIPHMPNFGIPYRSHFLNEYPLIEQEALIRRAKHLLEEAGAPSPIAFRAGGFAANSDTMIALRRCGISHDSSFNLFYQRSNCKLPIPRFYGRVTEFDGVLELPVAVFEDRPSHFRHAQLCACSGAEIIYALDEAEKAGWDFFVIVSHSFEMLTNRWHPTRRPIIREAVVDRFEKICKHLGGNRERFKTVGFPDLHSSSMVEGPEAPIRGKFLNTARRLVEQAAHRVQTR